MTTVIVYDPINKNLLKFCLTENDPMPYSYARTMLVKEFRGSSKSSILWTTTEAMEAWNATRRFYDKAIPFRYAFKRIWEGGHGKQSQHYAGVAFDVGQALNQSQRNKIHNIAKQLNVWSYVEPLNMTPTWVHFDKRAKPSACSAGYPLVKQGSKGVYVLILQDALNALGYPTMSIDGIFGINTKNAVIRFQKANNLGEDGIVGCTTWKRIVSEAVGIGKTPTVLDK